MRFVWTLLTFALVSGLAAPLSTGKAQTPSVFRDILSPGTAEAQAEEPAEEIIAAELLAQVESNLQKAEKVFQEYDSEAFRKRLEAAGLGATRQDEFVGVARQLVTTWTSAISILEAIRLREEAGEDKQPEAPTPPSDLDDAAAMERMLEQKNTERIKLEYDLEAAIDWHKQAEQNRRTARQELLRARQERERSDDSQVRLRASLREMLAEKRLELAEARLAYLQWVRETHRAALAAIQAEMEAMQDALARSGLDRILEATRAEKHLGILQERQVQLENLSSELSEKFTEISEEIRASRTAAEATQEEADDEQLGSERLRIFNLVESIQEIVQARLALIEREKNLWQAVSEVATQPSLEGLREIRSQVENTLQSMPSFLARLEARISETRGAAETLRQDLASPGLSEQQMSLLERRQETNQQLAKQLLEVKAELADLERVNVRLQDELVEEIAGQSFGEKLRVTLANFWSGFGKVWNHLLIDTEDRSITLGTIVVALFAFIFAIIAARFLSLKISRGAARRFRLAPSQSHLLEKLALYAFSIVLILTVLQWLQIPLTVFAFLGGALAVGIGFGSQNLINNFISGLILLFERMVNVGDLVEVDGNFGKVINLGSRCSTIQKFDGVEVLVPNSSLLEKNVVNWTLSDARHRFDFVVGVAYGSDLELVFKTLTEAMKEQPELLEDPAPEVAFEDFGASSLDFRLYYWLTLTACSARQVGSQLRARVDRLCRERGIEIAFPQQDVHLHVPDPIPVQQLPTPKNSGSAS